ncbi:MAG: methyltransferase [Methanospirillum sp.]
MLPESVIAGSLALLAVLFFFVRSAWSSRKLTHDRGVEGVPEYQILLGYIGLGAFTLVTVAYPVLYVLGVLDLVTGSPLQLRFPGDTTVQLAGMALLAAGLVLVFWSLDAIDPHGLTTRGPYAAVRHPMYMGYFFAFIGLFALTLNLLALLSVFVVPGQIAQARHEETGLEARHGSAWKAYAARTGRFWPRVR